MKLPILSAERGIGPCQGVYAGSPQPSAASAGLAPMAIVRANARPQLYNRRQLATEKLLGDQSMLCEPGEHPCWGDDGTPQALDYVCCPSYTECTVQADGDPACRPPAGLTQAIGNLQTTLGKDVVNTIRDYVTA